MANPDHVDLVRAGPGSVEEWRREHAGVQLELSMANLATVNLSGTDLSGADLGGANLSGTNLSGAYLNRADLTLTDLTLTDLSRTKLCDARLLVTNLSESKLDGADLSSACLYGVDLTGANLSAAFMDNTVLAFLDLRRVKGLETVRHEGPSSIGIETIYASNGEIPEIFLRGAGVPDTFIRFAKSLVGKPFDFYSCFISHSSIDQEFAERLHADLQAKGVRCWYAPEDLKIGDRFRTRIDEAIRIHDKLLIILSENSVQSSWVETEVETAFERERRESRTVLFPIRIDDAVMETGAAWAAEIRRIRHIGDFRNWKDHDSFQKAFERLLRDLKAEEQSPHARVGIHLKSRGKS
jgi:hypothetical protein